MDAASLASNHLDIDDTDDEIEEKEGENKNKKSRGIVKYGSQGFCVDCNRFFKSLYSARRHHETVHADGSNPPVICDICFSKHKNKPSLQYHMRTKHKIYADIETKN